MPSPLTFRDLGRLPFTSSPIPDETPRSYIRRLASLNELDPDHLRRDVRDSAGRITLPRLATASGQPIHALKYAMLELCPSDELAAMRVAGRPRPGTCARTACPQCAARRGALAPVECWSRQEDVVCLRHQWWHAGVRLTELPEVLAANRLHRRLIRRFGRDRTRIAIASAGGVCFDWIRRYEYDQGFASLARRAAPEGRVVLNYDSPLYNACIYPQVVALAAVLASPHWSGLLFDPTENPKSLARVVERIRTTVAPGFEFYGQRDPLVNWYVSERKFQHSRLLRSGEPVAVEPEVFDSASKHRSGTT